MQRTRGAPQIGACMLIAVAVAVFAQCALAATGPPVSRPTGYQVSIPGKIGTTAVVLQTNNYVLQLEVADAGGSTACALTVRHLFSSPIGHLVWSANYFVGTLVTSTQCTLIFTKDGDLQLHVKFMGSDNMVWDSNTAGKGVTHMALENVFDSGDVQLLGASNNIVWHTFGIPEFAILPTQKFTPGELLRSPLQSFDDSLLQFVEQGLPGVNGVYLLKLVNGDLQLFSDFGQGVKQYWSLHRTLFKGDVSKVAYAGIVTSVGGIGLFRKDGSVVYTTGPLPLIGRESNPHDTYFTVDPDGNLRTYYMVKGLFWTSDFQALPKKCDLPNFCGQYGLCSNEACSCPAGFTPVKASDPTQGCQPKAAISKCGSKAQRFLPLTGYDYVYNQYAPAAKVPRATCNADCLKDCACVAYFYDLNSGSCYLTNEVRTLQKVADAKKLAFLRL